MKTFLTLMLSATILMGAQSARANIVDTTNKALKYLDEVSVPLTSDERDFFESMKKVSSYLNNYEWTLYSSPATNEAVYFLLEMKAFANKVSALDLSIETDVIKLKKQMGIYYR